MIPRRDDYFIAGHSVPPLASGLTPLGTFRVSTTCPRIAITNKLPHRFITTHNRWHCVFHDPYERINFWTHAIPGLAFLCLGIVNALLPQQAMALFSLCAAATHCFSALTHVYPDSHSIEKLDHIGITATIIGTPISSLMAQEHGHLPFELKLISLWLVGAAFLKPTPRVVGFVVGATAMVVLYGSMLLSYVFAIELALYLGGALFFLRNDGHERGIGLSDHHILHYFVTVASVLHLWYLQQQQ